MVSSSEPSIWSIKIDPKTNYPLRNECLSHPFFRYYLSDANARLWQQFYTDVDGIQTEFTAFWVMVARRFKGYRNVLGYELLNEPLMGDFYVSASVALTHQHIS